MHDDVNAVRIQVARQVAHWRAAVIALADLDNFASPDAWRRLEQYLSTSLRTNLRGAVDRLVRESDVLAAELRAADTLDELELVRRHVVRFRRRFLRVETGLEFYGDAVNDRSSPKLGALLSACDILAGRALDSILTPLGKPVPPVLTYVDKGLGASIMRAGLRLWDGRTLSAAAAIKLTRHNLNGRPTALLHEAGHQIAFTLGWNDELAEVLRRELRDDPELATVWSGWSSEIAGDCVGFVYAGYAAVAALHDVIAGEAVGVYAMRPFDPHPIAHLRVLLGTAMATRFFGEGPWTDLSKAWLVAHPVARAPGDVRSLIERSLPRLPRIAEICLLEPMRAFAARPLTALVDPMRVRPDALAALARDAGASLGISSHWLWGESLRLLALSGYRLATEPDRAPEIATQFEAWMLRLGNSVQVAA
ncbi:hypothetical protein ACQI4L_06940 [Mycolicibacterium litorale]|uniref:hypothetical protein n=1 Tax=Mycolicibacterium litorale TaxID=758802 RepID=UPI003CF10A54